jgi:hypothetical protein
MNQIVFVVQLFSVRVGRWLDTQHDNFSGPTEALDKCALFQLADSHRKYRVIARTEEVVWPVGAVPVSDDGARTDYIDLNEWWPR